MAKIHTYKNKGRAKPSVTLERNKTKKSTGSTIITRGLPRKHKRDCYAKNLCFDLQREYPPNLFPVYPGYFLPVCPVLKKRLNEIPLSKLNIQETKSKTLDSTKRILLVFRDLIKWQPTAKVICLCAHRKNILKDFTNLVKGDLSLLPKRLEKEYPETSQKCAELVAEMQVENIRYQFNHPDFVYLMPPASALGHYLRILDWQQQEISDFQFIGDVSKGLEMARLTCHYPAQAVKIMDRICQELEPLEQILSEEPAEAGQQKKAGKKVNTKKRRKRKIKLTNKQRDIWERIRRGATESELAAEQGCSVTNIRQQYKKAEEKLDKLNAGSRSINFQKTQKIPTDRRGQETVADKG